MDYAIAILLACVSILLTVNIYILKSMREDLRGINEHVNSLWEAFRKLSERLVIMETKMSIGE